jgi:hypothetical protein
MNNKRHNQDLRSPHDAIGARDDAPPNASPARCRNCGADAPGAYCAACGQETHVALPTVRELMRDAAGRLVAVDSRLWRTLYVLLFRPGMLTWEYLHGRRKRYVRPARLFFVMSLLLFAAIRFLVAPTNVVTLDFTEERPAVVGTTPAVPGAAPSTASDATRHAETTYVDPDIEDLVARFGKYVPSDMRRRIERFKYLSREEQADHIYSGMMRNAPYGMVALLPAFAFLQYLSYLPGRRRHPQRPQRYAEHLVYGAHLHAFAFLMIVAVVVMPLKMLQAMLAVWIVIYVVRARQKVYGGSWSGGLLRTALVASVYIALLGFVMVALLALSVATR